MAYIDITDFKLGIDRRKSRVNGQPGSLWTLTNGVISRGGEVQRCKAFVPVFTVPGTHGLGAVGGQLFVFGHLEGLSVPAGVNYQRLVHPHNGALALTRVLDVEPFDGELYVIAEFSDGNVFHYYGGERVAAWDAISAAVADLDGVAATLAGMIDAEAAFSASAVGSVLTVTASTPGVGFTCSASANGAPAQQATGSFRINGGTSSPGVNKVTAVKVNGVDILGAAVNWSTSHAATATAIKNQINAYASSPEYAATVSGQVVTLTAALGTGSTVNGYTVEVVVGGNVVADQVVPMSGGVSDDQTAAAVETQPNVVYAAEVRARGSFQITGGSYSPGTNRVTEVLVNGVDILGAPVDWATSNAATAAAVAAQATLYASSPEYAVTAVGAEVRITAAAGTGNGPNGFAVVPGVAGDVTVGSVSAMAGGSDEVLAQAQIVQVTFGGTFEAPDSFHVVLNGTDYSISGSTAGVGTSAVTFRGKVYSTTRSLLYFSALKNASLWSNGDDEAAIGAGFINMANQSQGSERLCTSAEYQGLLSVFGSDSIRIWRIFEDEANNEFVQTVQATGTDSPRSVTPFGNMDVFYLDKSGVRSLRPRDSSGAANVSDVGTAIDTIVQAHMADLAEGDVRRACALMDPEDGRYWLALGERIYVFSYFTGSKISAWSTFEPGFAISDLVRAGRRICVRSGDTVYVYGGWSGGQYPAADELPCTIESPFLSGGKPATRKRFHGFDVALTNAWDIELLPDPARVEANIGVGRVAATTYADGRVAASFVSTHVAVRMVCRAAGQASVSCLSIHFDDPHEAG